MKRETLKNLLRDQTCKVCLHEDISSLAKISCWYKIATINIHPPKENTCDHWEPKYGQK